MSESTEQQHLIYWFRAQYPDKIIYANANAAWFPKLDARRRAAYGAQRKREGLLAGVSDLFIPEPLQILDKPGAVSVVLDVKHGLYLELKDVGKSEKDLTDSQIWFIEEMRKRGYAAHWASGFDHGQAVIKNYSEHGI